MTTIHYYSEQMDYETDNIPREIIEGFIEFLEEELSSYTWITICKNKKFQDISDKIPKYGDAVFQNLVNIVSDILGWEIKQLLSAYGNHRNRKI